MNTNKNEALGLPRHTVRAVLTFLPLLALIIITLRTPTENLIEILKMLTVMSFVFYFNKVDK